MAITAAVAAGSAAAYLAYTWYTTPAAPAIVRDEASTSGRRLEEEERRAADATLAAAQGAALQDAVAAPGTGRAQDPAEQLEVQLRAHLASLQVRPGLDVVWGLRTLPFFCGACSAASLVAQHENRRPEQACGCTCYTSISCSARMCQTSL